MLLFWAQNKPLNSLSLRGFLILGYKQGINRRHYPLFFVSSHALSVRSARSASPLLQSSQLTFASLHRSGEVAHVLAVPVAVVLAAASIGAVIISKSDSQLSQFNLWLLLFND